MKLGRAAYPGLGFYLAPYEGQRHPHNYHSCFMDSQLFLRLPYPKFSGSLLTATDWQGGLLKLKAPRGEKIWCQPGTGNIMAELIFYKDLVEARKAYTGKTVWLKSSYFMTLNGRKNPVRYPMARFTPLKVVSVKLGPVSRHTSLRVNLLNPQGLPGYLDINFTGVNRAPPFRGLENHVYLRHPREVFGVSKRDWRLIVAGKTRLGMTLDTVRLALGDPLLKKADSDYLSLIYNTTGKRVEYLFHRKVLNQVIPHRLDELSPGVK